VLAELFELVELEDDEEELPLLLLELEPEEVDVPADLQV